MSTCVAKSAERRTSDIDVAGSRPPTVIRQKYNYVMCCRLTDQLS